MTKKKTVKLGPADVEDQEGEERPYYETDGDEEQDFDDEDYSFCDDYRMRKMRRMKKKLINLETKMKSSSKVESQKIESQEEELS